MTDRNKEVRDLERMERIYRKLIWLFVVTMILIGVCFL